MTSSVRVGDGLPQSATHEDAERAPKTLTEPETLTASPTTPATASGTAARLRSGSSASGSVKAAPSPRSARVDEQVISSAALATGDLERAPKLPFADLEQRIDSACPDPSGLTPAQLAAHRDKILAVVTQAKERHPLPKRAVRTTYLGYPLSVTPHGIRVYTEACRRILLGEFRQMREARAFIQDRRRQERATLDNDLLAEAGAKGT